MVVLQPLKPGAPRVTLALKRGRARRALSLLGRNDAQQNLKLAESLLTISCEDFAKKWNFDPIQGAPLNGGKFQWTPLASETPRGAAPEEDDLQACLGVPSIDLPRPDAAPKVECRLVVASLEAGQPTCVSRTPSSAPPTPTEASQTPTPATDNTEAVPEVTSAPQPAASSREVTPTPETAPQEVSAPAEPSEGSIAGDEDASGDESPASSTATLSLRQTCITDFVRPRKRRAVSLESHYHVPHKKPLLQLRA